MIADVPLPWRRALVLASDLLNNSLIAEGSPHDSLELDAPGEQDVANVARHEAQSGNDA
jgi:hypothetical protein